MMIDFISTEICNNGFLIKIQKEKENEKNGKKKGRKREIFLKK